MSLIEFVEGHAVPPRRPSAKKVRTAPTADASASKSEGKAAAKKPAAASVESLLLGANYSRPSTLPRRAREALQQALLGDA